MLHPSPRTTACARSYGLVRSLLRVMPCLSALVRADSTVVFNELMYHPASSEAAMEWVELHNEMAVNMDLSGWSLAGGVDFRFAEGTVLPGGGYLVVAVNPAALVAATGATNVFGPFTGRLSNSGETLELRNNNQRLMDSVRYRTSGDWPVAADGAGPSLAKRKVHLASEPAESWRASAQVGGTPGTVNFPGTTAIVAVPLVVASQSWAVDDSGVDPGTLWRDPTFPDIAWRRGPAPFYGGTAPVPGGDVRVVPGLFNTGTAADGQILAPGSRDPHYIVTASAEAVSPPPPAPALVIEGHPAWLANDAQSSWIGPVTPGTASVAAGDYRCRTSFDLTGFDPASAQLTFAAAADNRLSNVLLNGVSRGSAYVGYNAFSADFQFTSGFVAGVNTLEFLWANDGPGANPAGFRVRARVTARAVAAPESRLGAVGATTYFRSRFVFTGNPATTQLTLLSRVNDGAAFYLNGVEVARINLPAGPLTATTSALAAVAAPPLTVTNVLPASALKVGTNVLAVEVHQAADGRQDAWFAAELSAGPVVVPTEPDVVLNELAGVGAATYFVELANRTARELSLTGYVLRRVGSGAASYEFPAGVTLPAAGRRAFTSAELGFRASAGDQLILVAPGRNVIADALVVRIEPQARFPDGVGRWLVPSAPTPGAPNEVFRQTEVVINEIMYHPREATPGPWLELFNRSAAAVDLSEWRFTSGIDYRFAAGTTLPAGGYLVVARDPVALLAANPGLRVVGPYTNTLSGRSDLLVLANASGNPADEVRYFDGGRWAAEADGSGSSLELRNPWADHAAAESWAASRESAATGWTNYSYRAVATAATEPVTWKEFVLGLLDAGECLIDDLRVVESPDTAPVSLLSNGNFENGAAAWRFLGTHRHSEVIVDPDQPGNHVLHLVATGPTEHMHNHLETTLTNNRAVVNGRTYAVSYRARWLSGNAQLNTRLYFNRVARTTRLATPVSRGTPGARNSTYVENPGPTFADLQHTPTVPKAAEAVTVSARVSDPQGVASVQFFWSINGGGWQSRALVVPADGRVSGTVPGAAAGSVVQFYLQAADTLGATAFFPAAGPASRALYNVNDQRATTGPLHNLRLVMTPADTGFLHALTNVMSNELLRATVVYDEQESFYDVGVHLQGSERGRSDPGRVGFTIEFAPDHLFRGVHGGISIDRSGGYTGVGGDQDEILLKHALQHAGGLPGMYDDLVRIIPPRADLTGPGLLILAKYGNVFLDSQYARGSDGGVFKLELIYSPTTTSGGTPQSPKLPQPDDVVGVDLGNLGDNPESYRWFLLHENNREQDDYQPVMALAKALNKTGTALDADSRRLMDVSTWMRAVAFQSLWGLVDTYPFDNPHNFMIYFRPEDGRALPFLWDMDYNFGAAATSPINRAGGNLARLIGLPGNQRLYQGHLLDLITTTYNTNYLTPWINHFGSLAGQNFGGIRSYVDQRVKSVRSQLTAAVPFAVTSTGTTTGWVNAAVALISGRAGIDVREIRIEGRADPLEFRWSNLTTWQTTVPLVLGTNQLRFLAYGFQGQLVASNTVNVTSAAVGGGVDSDADGLPDVWETAFGTDPLTADAGLDLDHDGQTNGQEYLAGTDPRAAASVLKMEARSASDGLHLGFLARAGRSYSLLSRPALSGVLWDRVLDVLPEAADHPFETTLAPLDPAGARFYRVVTPRLP